MHRISGYGKQGRRLFMVLVVALFVLPVAIEPAAAHKVTVFAWVEGDTVQTESKFSGGRMAKQARIEVYDGSGNLLLDGQTDDEGHFGFKAPQKDDLQVVLIAGAGHRNEWVVKAEEFTGPTLLVAEGDAVPTKVARPPVEASLPEGVDVTRDELQMMIETALDKKLQPVLNRLRQVDDGPRLADIVAGLGYILGLVGLGAYIHYRRRSSAEGTRAR